MLANNSYVIVFALHFSKAFDMFVIGTQPFSTGMPILTYQISSTTGLSTSFEDTLIALSLIISSRAFSISRLALSRTLSSDPHHMLLLQQIYALSPLWTTDSGLSILTTLTLLFRL